MNGGDCLRLGCCVDGSCTSQTCMGLPEGKKCGDCRHLRRCMALGYTESPERTECDFFPRRFLAVTP